MTHILQGIDALGRLLNFTSDDFGNEFGRKLWQATAAGFSLDDFCHFLPDCADLRRASIGGLFDLIGSSLGECNGEQTKKIIVRGFDRDIGFDEGLPFANK